MYMPEPYRKEKYNQFIIVHDGRFFRCCKYWSVERDREGNFTIFIQERCREFVIKMVLSVRDIRTVGNRLISYGLHVCSRNEYSYMLVYLRFYCNKVKHRPYWEVKDVIIKHFLRLGVYLSSSVIPLIIFFHSFSTTFGDIRENNTRVNRQYRRMLP